MIKPRKSFAKLVKHLKVIASPHYYYGDSLLKLSFQKLILLVLYLKTSKPNKRDFKELLQLRNTKEGLTALVLGNGPSLDNLRIENVKSNVDDIFAVNSYYKTKIGRVLKPSYYILSDPESPEVVSSASNDVQMNFLEYIKVNKIKLFLPKYFFGSNTDTVIFNDVEKPFGKQIDPTRPRSYTSVTLYKALAIACYLGYEKIYLIGLDNSEFSSYYGDLNNKIWCDNKHWSGIESIYEKTINPEMQHLFTSGMAGRMTSYSRLFGHLEMFPKNRIINLDEKSLTDSFKKVSEHPLIKADKNAMGE